TVPGAATQHGPEVPRQIEVGVRAELHAISRKRQAILTSLWNRGRAEVRRLNVEDGEALRGPQAITRTRRNWSGHLRIADHAEHPRDNATNGMVPSNDPLQRGLGPDQVAAPENP